MSSIREIALAKAIGGGGGPSVTVEELNVTQNGTTTAPSGKAYNPVNVAVPNTYSAGDEGKVVSNGALVAQTAHATVTQNGTIDTTLNNSVVVDVPQGGGGGVAANAVNFRDFDGTIVAAYSVEDFAALTALPANPSHDGLTAQGWNWSFADAQAYVTKYGRLEIGQMYITDDGKTRVYIHLEQGRTSPMLGVCPSGTVDVDWGDGTAHDTLTGSNTSSVKWTPTHHYAAPGDYIIKLTVTGSMSFYGVDSSNQHSALLRYSTSGDTRNYVYLNAVHKIEIGNGVSALGSYAFYDCGNLVSITMPDSVQTISGRAFWQCFALASIVLPNSVTTISGNAFASCYTLNNISIPNSAKSISSYAFSLCYSLTRICFSKDMSGINANVLYECRALSSIVIPSGISNIGSSAFGNCYGIAEYHLAPTTPPTLSSSAFTNMAADCVIYVPYSADHSVLNAYKTAENWGVYASQMREEPA